MVHARSEECGRGGMCQVWSRAGDYTNRMSGLNFSQLEYFGGKKGSTTGRGVASSSKGKEEKGAKRKAEKGRINE